LLPGLVPRFVVEAHDLAEWRGAVIIDENIELAEMLERLGNDALAIGRFADVGCDGEDLASRLVANDLRRGLQLLGATRHQRDVRTISREAAGNAVADALARAADDRDLAGKVALGAHAASPNSRDALPVITLPSTSSS
jgi:hypothetical protein